MAVLRSPLLWAAVAFALAGNAWVLAMWSPDSFFATIARIYHFNTLVLPAALVLLAAFAWRPARRLSVGLGVVALLGVSTYVFATHIEPNRLVLRRARIVSSKVKRPLRILHVSDIQSPKIGAHELAAFELMRELDPDLIVHTGDLLQPIRPATLDTEVPVIRALFSELHPKLGIFHVTGDTDAELQWVSGGDLGGVRVLEDAGATLRTDDGVDIAIFGLSLGASAEHARATEHLDRWLKVAKPGALTIALGHRPDFVEVTRHRPIDLTLAGHTHGGQVRLPFVGAVVTLSDIPREWARGFRQVDQTHLNVSAGIGAEHAAEIPSIRFLCPPEMTLIEIVPPS